jgi:hypothetical protein
MFNWKNEKVTFENLKSIPQKWLENVDNFFEANPKYIKILVLINNKLRNNDYISLRKINFFITMYSRLKQTTITNKNVFVFHEYDEQLSFFRRKYFDPFRRGNLRINFCLDGAEYYSTFPQLNFFMWFFNNNFYEYIRNNSCEITELMSKVTREHRAEKKKLKQNGENRRLMYTQNKSECIALKKKSYFSYSS